MFIRNNPDIDFDQLEADVLKRLERYRDEFADNATPPEFDAQRLTWMGATLRNPASSHADLDHGTPVERLEKLYSREGEAFVRGAHYLLLGRDPSETEVEMRMTALERGESKARIVHQIRYSPEGQRYDSDVTLGASRYAFRLMALPVVGPLFDVCFNVVQLGSFRRYVEATRRGLREQARDLQRQHDDLARTTASGFTDLKQQLVAEMARVREDQVAATSKSREEHQAGVNELKAENKRLEERVGSLQMRLTAAESAGNASSSTPGTGPDTQDQPSPPVAVAKNPTDDAFYVALETRFRGLPQVVRERLGVYRPLLDTLPPGPVADLGCGRGEWLSLLREAGIEATGIDLNATNIDTCRASELQAIHRDALTWLAEQPAGSLAAVSAFHLIEHIAFDDQLRLIRLALTALAPGGLLLLETPNPENLLVASNSFYYDPTHVRPLPPALAEFMLEYHGFVDVTVQRINDADADQMLKEPTEVSARVNHLLYAAQDYAVYGRRPAA